MTATIRSNCGDSEVMIDISSSYKFVKDEGFHAAISIRCPFWDDEGHDFPINLRLDGFRLSHPRLINLTTQLSTWSNHSLEELAKLPLVEEFELCAFSGQSVQFKFGPRGDTIDERKPVLSFAVRMGRVRMEIHFVTVQSCIAIFVGELLQAMKQ